MVMAREAVCALLADEQPTQKVLHPGQARAVAAPIALELLRRACEQLLIHDRWHGHDDVLVGRCWDLAVRPLRQAMVPTRRIQWRLPTKAPPTAVDGPPGVGGIQQHGVDHGPAPVCVAGRARYAGGEQPAAHGGQGQTLVADPGKDLTDHLGLVLVDPVARQPASGRTAHVAIAEGSASEDADRARLGEVPLAAPAALQHLGPLVLGRHALQQ